MEMASVQTFRGIRYNQGKVEDLDAVVAPPYDVISPEQKECFLARHSNNVVRLILPDEADGRDKYSQAAHLLRKWLDEGILIEDGEPMMYVCEQSYGAGGETMRRIGLTCLVRLEDYGTGAILPHERVLARPREDRLNLIRATRANLDSVFGLHDGKGVQAVLQTITEGIPNAEATDPAGIACRMWKVSDPALVNELALLLDDEPILIADGHHRYDSALAYRNEMRSQAESQDPDAPHEFVMMTLVSLEDEGLTILPTHRLVRNIEGFDEAIFIGRLGESFDIRTTSPDELMDVVAAEYDGRTALGLYMGDGNAHVLTLKEDFDPTRMDIPGSDALKRLDVTVLHSMILDGILGIDTKTPEGQAKVAYTRDESAVTRVDSREFQLSFIMNAMKVEEVREVATAGDIMPQKSTFFYPKLLTGMVMRRM